MIIIFHQADHSFSPSNSAQRENQNNIYFYCVALLHFPFCLFLLMTLIAIIRNDRSPTTNEKLQFTSWTCKRHTIRCIKRENEMSRDWQFWPMEGWQTSYRSRSLLQFGACHDPAGSIHVDRSREGQQRQVNDIFSLRWDSFVRIVTREVLVIFERFSFVLFIAACKISVIHRWIKCLLFFYWNVEFIYLLFFFLLRKCKSYVKL